MAYIGLDIDSANPTTYESIRRSKMDSPFNKIKEVAASLGSQGAPIDVKALLMDQNTSDAELDGLFLYAKEISARGLHLRPMVLNDTAFEITETLQNTIKQLSDRHSIPCSVSLGRYEQRSYSKCHQMFLFPSFCSDGNIYLCCEYKGRPELKLGSWIDNEFDWRDLWCSERHINLYNNFRTAFCKPCRPNSTNNLIQHNLNDRSKVIESFI